MPLLNYYFLADDLGWGHQDAIPVSTTAFSRALSTAAVYARPAPWATGQLISECPFGVIIWTKIPTEKFDKFCSRIWKVVKSTK